jgi:uncharacterized protein (DUF58 family)
MSTTADIIKKVRRIEIKARGLSNHIFAGEYHSAFKGRGMSFSEVRSYQYGDDVRSIDWNVTARTGQAHIKVYEEERELTLLLIVDISKSIMIKLACSYLVARLNCLSSLKKGNLIFFE